MEVRKEIIRPGTYTYIHPRTGLPEKLVVTPDVIRHLHTQGNAMLSTGISIPVPVEHQAEAHPLTATERRATQLRNNAGWVKGWEVDKEGILFGILNIEDAEIAKKLPHTIRWTSPYVNSFTDGDGKRWEGVISHVALTTTPRITKQKPFAVDMAAALSLVASLSDRPFTLAGDAGGIALSRAGLLTKDAGGKFKPKYPMAFSLMSGIKLAKDELDEVIVDEEGDTEEEPDAVPKKGKDGEESDRPLDNVDLGDTSSDVSIHETIGHLLKALGFTPPDGMDETTFERDIYETLMAKVQEMGAKSLAEPEATPEPTQPEQNPTNPIIQESPAMYASLEEIEMKVIDPAQKRMAKALYTMQKTALDNAKRERENRIMKIGQKLPAQRRDQLLTMLAAPNAQLSITEDGAVLDPMADALAVIEAAAVDLPALLKGESALLAVQPHPIDAGTMDENKRQAVVSEVAKNAGYQNSAPAKPAA